MDIYIKRKIIFFCIIRPNLQSLETFEEDNAVLNIGGNWTAEYQVVSSSKD